MMIKNLMPHTFTLVSPEGVEKRKDGNSLPEGVAPTILRTVEREPVVARATQSPSTAGEPVDGIPTVAPTTFGAVENLPPPRTGWATS